MIIKEPDGRGDQLAELERLLSIAPADKKAKIEQELRAVRAGLKGENEAAYLIDFDLKNSNRTAIIHDLRLEVNGRVAQIDHLLILRTLTIFVLETKHFHAGVKVSEDGEFLRWNDFKKTFEGMPSPFAQNERHIAVLRDAFKQIEMPTRLGITLSPTFESFVLVSPKARIDRPKRFDTSRLIKADMLMDAIDKYIDTGGFFETLGAVSKIVSVETVEDISRKLVALHRPSSFNFAARFGLPEPTTSQISPPISESVARNSPRDTSNQQSASSSIAPTNHSEPITSQSPSPGPAGSSIDNVAEVAVAAPSGRECRSCGSDQISVQYGIVEVVLATLNATPTAALGFKSPIDYLRYYLSDPDVHIPTLDADDQKNLNKLNIRFEATVRGSAKRGKRPYVQILGGRYTSEILSLSADLIGKVISVYIDSEDARYGTAYFADGTELGLLEVKGHWKLTKHTIETRQAVIRAKNKQLIFYTSYDDPIHSYVDFLNDEAPKNKKARRNLLKMQKTAKTVRNAHLR